MQRTNGWLLLIASICVPLPLQAAPSLADMLAAADKRHPGVELADAERKLATALSNKAEQPFASQPSANIKYQTDAVGSELGYREWEGGIDMPLWLPGQADSYRREAESTLATSDAIAQARKLKLAGQVRERLWAAAIARGEAEQAQSAVSAAKQLLQDVQQRVEAGELPRNDQLLAQKELIGREESLQQAKVQARQADQMFQHYTGIELPEQPGSEPLTTPAELADSHPSLQLARLRADQAQARRDRVSSESRPSPNLWLGAKSAKAASGNDYESSVGIELSMPFATGAHSAPAIAEAENSLTQARTEYQLAHHELQEALQLAQLELEQTSATLAQTEKRQRLAEASLKLNRRAFELGETDLVRLIQAQADALSARHDYQIRQLQHSQAVARLNQALGVIPQ
ncbi:MAG: TolC family protein [Chromatiales bacterium]|jgi:outer membrane protein TolC